MKKYLTLAMSLLMLCGCAKDPLDSKLVDAATKADVEIEMLDQNINISLAAPKENKNVPQNSRLEILDFGRAIMEFTVLAKQYDELHGQGSNIIFLKKHGIDAAAIVANLVSVDDKMKKMDIKTVIWNQSGNAQEKPK